MIRPIHGYRYCVTDSGEILSDGKPKSLYQNKFGYIQVTLYKDGFAKLHMVHRLVAKAFVPNPDKKPHVNHKDGNKGNNVPSNLEWCTREENMRHSVDVLKNEPWNKGKKTGATGRIPRHAFKKGNSAWKQSLVSKKVKKDALAEGKSIEEFLSTL